MTITIDISKHSEGWPDVGALIERAVKGALEGANFTDETEVSIVLADDAFIQNLNKEYRGKDKPTNVLSFPQGEPFSLGDIILARETITREAEDQKKSFDDHLSHLTVHGILHLLGFDHEEESEAEEMEALEIEILEKMGLKNPYETSSAPPDAM